MEKPRQSGIQATPELEKAALEYYAAVRDACASVCATMVREHGLEALIEETATMGKEIKELQTLMRGLLDDNYSGATYRRDISLRPGDGRRYDKAEAKLDGLEMFHGGNFKQVMGMLKGLQADERGLMTLYLHEKGIPFYCIGGAMKVEADGDIGAPWEGQNIEGLSFLSYDRFRVPGLGSGRCWSCDEGSALLRKLEVPVRYMGTDDYDRNQQNRTTPFFEQIKSTLARRDPTALAHLLSLEETYLTIEEQVVRQAQETRRAEKLAKLKAPATR